MPRSSYIAPYLRNLLMFPERIAPSFSIATMPSHLPSLCATLPIGFVYHKVQMTRHISGSRAMPLNADGHCP
jgi:hypothetical protein